MPCTDTNSLLWFDYETFGASTIWDRPTQFAALRTDTRLNIVEDPIVLHGAPPGDYLPHPEACRITGLDPITQAERGEPEAMFIARAVAELGRPGTCSIGYNSIRFDDEITRHTLFRNFHDAYSHEYRDRNSRWDLLDVVRLTRALRPEGLHWPVYADGRPSNRLEDLARVNGIEHQQAHDALSDVEATLALAQLIRYTHPKLFEFAMNHRDRNSAATLLNWTRSDPVLEVSGLIPASRHHLALILPMARHPKQNNSIIVLDLETDPESLLDLDAEQISARMFAPDHTPEQKLHVRAIRTNRCPVLVPMSVLRDSDAVRLGIDMDQIQRRCELGVALRATLAPRLQDALSSVPEAQTMDVEGTLYSGGFLDDNDKALCQKIRELNPAALATLHGQFNDSRLDELLFRYRARNFPQHLDASEQDRWRRTVSDRLNDAQAPWLDFASFDQAMNEQPWTEDECALKRALQAWRARCAALADVDTLQSRLVP